MNELPFFARTLPSKQFPKGFQHLYKVVDIYQSRENKEFTFSIFFIIFFCLRWLCSNQLTRSKLGLSTVGRTSFIRVYTSTFQPRITVYINNHRGLVVRYWSVLFCSLNTHLIYVLLSLLKSPFGYVQVNVENSI